MESGETRAKVSVDDLIEPDCPIARPGDTVVWYRESVRRRGTLLGSTWDGKPFIRPEFGVTDRLPSFEVIRVEDPARAVGPIWRFLPHSGLLVHPTDAERKILEELGRRVVPPGFRHYDLMTEIWDRGFEVFLAGGSVRDVLAGVPGRDADVVTTMPVSRLRQTIVDMYGASRIREGDSVQQAGCFRVGDLGSIAETHLEVRAFRYASPGSVDAVYGASFDRDMALGDFSCNAVYYDPINDVFIDPSGFGLDDAAACRLRPVMDFKQRSGPEKAWIGLQLIARCLMADPEIGASPGQSACRRYQLAEGAEGSLLELVDSLRALTPAELVAGLKEKIFVHLSGDENDKWAKVREWLLRFGREGLWVDFIEPSLESQR
jgi:hypothetical protein